MADMGRAPKVLIVEDNYLLLDMLVGVCEQHGVAVVAASSGEAALTLLRSDGRAIDWLFTDIKLPGLIDGWTVAEAYRDLHPDRPVIYASSLPHRESRAVPGSLFLRKPFQMRDVVELARMMASTRSDPARERHVKRAAG